MTLALREAKIERARVLRRGANMTRRNEGEKTGTVS